MVIMTCTHGYDHFISKLLIMIDTFYLLFSSFFGTVCPHRVSISCEPVVAERPSWITCRSGVSNPAPRLLWAMEGKEIDNIP